LVEYWLSHLAEAGAKEVLILAPDRPEQVRRVVEDGAAGVEGRGRPESRELTVDEAAANIAMIKRGWLEPLWTPSAWTTCRA